MEHEERPRARGLRGDVARLFSWEGTTRGRPSLGAAARRVLTRPGPQAVALFRVSHWLWARGLQVPAEVVWRVNTFLTGADIHPAAEIGGGFRMTHASGVVIGSGVRIGDDVTLLHAVTLGGSVRDWFGGSPRDGYPVIGDRTEIMAGAKVLGPITVGRACYVGANAVLARDLPDGEAYTPGRQVGELRRRVEELERRVRELEGTREPPAVAGSLGAGLPD
ncbi:MAG: serine O-acetyltransferase [Actinomycetota bacterium]